MRHSIIISALACLTLGSAYAESKPQSASYAGAVVGLMEVGGGCTNVSPCDYKGKYTKLYAGTQVSSMWFVEAALIDFGKAQFNTDDKATAHAIALSLAYRQEVFSRLTLSTRLGVAYVQTNLKTPVVNLNEPAIDSSNKLQPLLGFGAEYAITDLISAVASADFSRAKLAEHSARINTYGLGLSVNFGNK